MWRARRRMEGIKSADNDHVPGRQQKDQWCDVTALQTLHAASDKRSLAQTSGHISKLWPNAAQLNFYDVFVSSDIEAKRTLW